MKFDSDPTTHISFYRITIVISAQFSYCYQKNGANEKKETAFEKESTNLRPA